jgi:hypothetical protein
MSGTPRTVRQDSKESVVGDGKVGQDSPREISVTGIATIEPAQIEAVPAEALRNTDKLDKLKFMDDPVEIVVMQSSDKNAKPYIELWVNGIRQNVMRGQPIVVKRKYVETLARMKLTTFVTQTPIEDGEVRNVAIPSTGLVAPFTVIRDPAGDRGRVWLSQILAEA